MASTPLRNHTSANSHNASNKRIIIIAGKGRPYVSHPIVHSQLDRFMALMSIAKHVKGQVDANPPLDPYLEAYEPETLPPPPHEAPK